MGIKSPDMIGSCENVGHKYSDTVPLCRISITYFSYLLNKIVCSSFVKNTSNFFVFFQNSVTQIVRFINILNTVMGTVVTL